VAVIRRVPKLGRFVFSLTGEKPFSRFDTSKRAIDELCGVTNWRLHDHPAAPPPMMTMLL
jgi:hypothetical protein